MNEPVIVDAQVTAGHDGQAEISVHVRHPNGAVRDICFPHDAIGPVLDARGITTVDQLIGLEWTILLEPPTPSTCTTATCTTAPTHHSE